MTSLVVVGFASGSPLSQAAMERIAIEHRLAAIVVVPRRRGGLMQRMRRAPARHEESLARLGTPLVDASQVPQFRPDVIAVASFPKILSANTLAAARIGALNLHMSLLPRHRGIDPIFWTYWDDDRHAGVTIHWMNERIDSGDIAAQEAVPLERGLASRELYRQLAPRGTDLLARVLDQVASGNAARLAQDDTRATYESAADIARARIPFSQWPAERVWHVLSGLGDQRTGLLDDSAGRPLAHGRAARYRLTGKVESGRVVEIEAGYEVHCLDGIVAVDRRRDEIK